ncbi:MAG: DUF4351 domain-containing protein [Magnetococcales bacterium]|nr:DUF4351 domain-containing protein [Magnetococcales bacterium]
MEGNAEKNRSQYDTTLKDLFTQPPQRLLQAIIGRQAKRMLPVEFASTQKRVPDLLFLLDDDTIFHLELQGRPEKMNWRMLMYYALIRQRYPKRTLFQRILYVGERPWHAQPVITEPCLRFHYEVVDMRSVDCRELLASPVLEENILAVLCRMPDRHKGVHDILYRISALPTKARADALTKLLVLSRLRRLESTIKTEAAEMALTFNIMENDVLRPMFLEAQKEIRQKAQREEAATILLRQMRRRFGEIPAQWIDKVNTAELELIETWSDNILDARSIEEVFTGPPG